MNEHKLPIPKYHVGFKNKDQFNPNGKYLKQISLWGGITLYFPTIFLQKWNILNDFWETVDKIDKVWIVF